MHEFLKKIEYARGVPGDIQAPTVIALKPVSEAQVRSEQLSVPARVEITPETAKKLKEARQIMGGRLIMPDAVESALGTRIDLRYVNDFPFSEEQLKILNHDSVIMYFADETSKGMPITMHWLDENKAGKTKRVFRSLITRGRGIINSDYTQTPDNRYAGHEFYEHQTPRPGWRSFTVNVVPESKNKDVLGQTEALIDHLKSRTFKDIVLPDDIQSALKDYYAKKRQIRDVMIKDPVEAARLLMNSDLAKLTRVTAVELSYASHILSEVYERRFLAFERSTTLSHDTRYPEVVTIGNFDLQHNESKSAIERVLPVHPKRRYSDTGAVLSLGADALPIPPQVEELKPIEQEKLKLVLLPAPAKEAELQPASDLPFDPERDISAGDFKRMTEYIREHGLNNNRIEMASHMKIFSPQRLSAVYPNFDWSSGVVQYAFHHRNNAINSYRDSLKDGVGGPLGLSELARRTAALKLLAPDAANKFKLSRSLYRKIEKEMQRLADNETASCLELFHYMNILYPGTVRDKFGNMLNRKIIDDRHNDFQSRKEPERSERYLETETFFKLLSPNYDGQVDWDRVKIALYQARTDNDYEKYAKMAAYATILAAEEVRVTDRGLEITMRKPEKKQAPAVIRERKTEGDPVFDPERDIPKKDRENFFRILAEHRHSKDFELLKGYKSGNSRYIGFFKYYQTAIALSRLFPEHYRRIDKWKKPDENDYDLLLEELVEDSNIGRTSVMGDYQLSTKLEAASTIRNLYGNKRINILGEIGDHVGRIVKENLRSGRQIDYLREYANLNMVYPNWVTQNYVTNYYASDYFASEKLLRRWRGADKESANIPYWVQNEADYRIITGRQCHFVNRGLIQKEIERARENKEYDLLMSIYHNLLISTAGEVRVTDQGLVVNAKKPVKQETAPRLPQWTF